MKLKKLEVIGFKSFLDKAQIDFPQGISAIVGPNGCGKSNVIDAIRWAMGEQSVKQLRGKSMEDIIFSGADGKPPLNMAEVTLTLLNTNGTSPEEFKDFKEIQVTRKLYRSGESLYLINKRACRLKDIHNLFMGSGMGSRSYAVIQQGNIGAITDAGPDERRVFLEEAAGVSRYKTRKKEALQKVDATNQNLLRLNDVISEVHRQMEGLNRQAKKAERYRKIQDKVRKLDILVHLNQYVRLCGEIDEAAALLVSIKDEDLAHSTQLKKLDAAVEKIKLERAQKINEISKQKSTRFEIQRRIDTLENDLEHLRQQLAQREKELDALKSARIELEGKNRHIADEVTQSEHEIAQLDKEIVMVKTTLQNERKNLLEMKQQVLPLTEKLEENKKKLMELVAQEARINNIYQTTSQNLESIERRIKRIDEEAALAEKKVMKLSDDEKTAQKHLAECRENLAVIDSDIRSLREELEIKSELLGNQVKLVQTLELSRKEKKSRYNALKKMDENFEWYKDGVKAILRHAASQEEVESGILGIVADVITPEPGYEIAVEVVLGEGLQYVLVKDQHIGESSINYLAEQNVGRSGFIPLSDLRKTPFDDTKPDQSRMLLSHILVKKGYERAMEALLENVTVVSDLKEALRVWNQNGKIGTIVTTDGQMISNQGIMAGGSKDKLSGILEKKRELKELKNNLSLLEEQINLAKKDQEQIEIQVRQLETDLQQQTQERNNILLMEMEAEKNLFKVSEELKSARRHLEIVQLEQDQLMGEQTDIDHEMTKYEKERSEIAQAVKNSQDNVSKTSMQIETLSSDLELHNQKVVDIQLSLTALTARFENNQNTLRRLKEFENDGITRLEQIAGDISIKEGKQKKDKDQIESNEKLLAQLYETFHGLDQQLENIEADFRVIDSRLKENDDIKTEIENKQKQSLEKLRYLEIEQSQREMRRDNIVNRLEERYSRNFDQLYGKYIEMLDNSDIAPEDMNAALEQNREKLQKIGDVNMGAIKEYEELKTRYDFLIEQRDDLQKAIQDLHMVIRKINRITQEKFMSTFEAVNEKMGDIFPRLFEGGSARLVLTEPDKPLETGVEFMIHPPGKKLTRLSLLSGGEKALSAIAFIFSIFLIKPASFCLLDEIDAPLDEANVFRFNNLLKMIGESSQIIMITHNKRTMEFSDRLLGVTMEKKGISKLVSVNLGRGGDGWDDVLENQDLN